jgi:hypothetical protein
VIRTDINADSNPSRHQRHDPDHLARLSRSGWTVVDALGLSARTYGSVSVVAVLLGGGLAGSVSVTRCGSLRIRPLRRALQLTCPSWLPAPAWSTSWPDQKPVRSRA